MLQVSEDINMKLSKEELLADRPTSRFNVTTWIFILLGRDLTNSTVYDPVPPQTGINSGASMQRVVGFILNKSRGS